MFASSSTRPSPSDTLAARLREMNEKIRARMGQVEEKAVDNMAEGLQATRITDGDKGALLHYPQQLLTGPTTTTFDTSLTSGSQQLVNLTSQERKNSLDQDTPSLQNYGKRRAEELLHERHGKIEAAGKSKVFHVSAEESLSLQKSPTKQLLNGNAYFGSSSEAQAPGQQEVSIDDPMSGNRRGSNITMSYGDKKPFDNLSEIARAAKLQSFSSYIPWDSDEDSDSDDELENAILYGDLDAIAKASERAEILEEADTVSESGSIADGMDMSGIIAVDMEKTAAKEPFTHQADP
ncbi:hypothetical protein QFC22_000132 [Naganishia vaughanmartiniae]|uniref:Uncharacterized protein n=1 Tax=Naganishia vaughanmartiniae TaxID=1424756 RepID=A0ACC2XNH7_9TREE|nr:hypothetical protein QFC22_000132 [Naganishia vaughanmartiniae]